ncbi:DUF4229 domain-containing protein [Frigoribacterium sp. Leaf172]|uniref:DUF4229 domain-containing protein n=1 Tax=Frigoribacterium sp. Leaf172 TaxID=1736285 RepID=UPI0006FA9829|nr:DUF4229 domain-containing protein [Frigoribacterium sp. Leaf172]KQR64976.1 hypothetical protein ASF89_11325 [Frigoribacterium sp. Leaf172]
MNPWVKYTFIRLGIFAVALAVLLVIRIDPFIATVVAAVVGLCVSYIFFAPLRRRVALDLAARRAKPETRHGDDIAEDEEIRRSGSDPDGDQTVR